ncbi:unnamed protein product [Amoebophrya sp. A25]|nr:unnamed protein product [Amoebophrya sp. A25]|eukprot:GSA25T00002188001.1
MKDIIHGLKNSTPGYASTTPPSRITADIADVDLDAEIPGDRKFVVLAKHFCANASDLATRLAVRLVRDNRLRIFACAPCCHHQGLLYKDFRRHKQQDKENYAGSSEELDRDRAGEADVEQVGDYDLVDVDPEDDTELPPEEEEETPTLESAANNGPSNTARTTASNAFYCGRSFWEDVCGFGAKHFSLAKQLIYLSKIPTLRSNTCKRWKLRDIYPDVRELKALGLLARRFLEEGRLRHLRESIQQMNKQNRDHDNHNAEDEELDIGVVQYCMESVTPDNLLLVCAPLRSLNALGKLQQSGDEAQADSSSTTTLAQKSGTAAEVATLGGHGLLCTLVAEATVACQPQKVCEFLLENRARFFPSILGCHICDAPLLSDFETVRTEAQNPDDERSTNITKVPQTNLKKKSKGPLGTETRQVIISSRSMLETAKELADCTVLAPLVDRIFPHNSQFSVHALEDTGSVAEHVGLQMWLKQAVLSAAVNGHRSRNSDDSTIPVSSKATSNANVEGENFVAIKCLVQPRRYLKEVLDLVLAAIDEAKDESEAEVVLVPGSNFTHTLSFAAWRGVDSATEIGVSLLPRDAYNPSAFSPDGRTKKKEQKTWFFRMKELQMRAASTTGHPLAKLLLEDSVSDVTTLASSNEDKQKQCRLLYIGDEGECCQMRNSLTNETTQTMKHVEVEHRTHADFISDSGPFSVNLPDMILVDLGKRTQWQKQGEAIASVKARLEEFTKNSKQLSSCGSTETRADTVFGLSAIPIVARVFANDVSKFEIRRHLKQWCTNLAALVKGASTVSRFEILHLLSDAKLERSLIMI